MNTFNLFAPRVGMSLSLTEDGRTVFKANYGKYWWNPGTTLSEDVNPNPEVWNRRYVWNDLNSDLLYQPGEEGRLNSSAGGLASAQIAADLQDTYTNEVAFWLERELVANFGVRTGAVWRGERQLAMQFNANRPFSRIHRAHDNSRPGRGWRDEQRRRRSVDRRVQPRARIRVASRRQHPRQRSRRIGLLHMGGHCDQADEQPLVGDVLVQPHLERCAGEGLLRHRCSGRTTCRSRRTI